MLVLSRLLRTALVALLSWLWPRPYCFGIGAGNVTALSQFIRNSAPKPLPTGVDSRSPTRTNPLRSAADCSPWNSTSANAGTHQHTDRIRLRIRRLGVRIPSGAPQAHPAMVTHLRHTVEDDYRAHRAGRSTRVAAAADGPSQPNRPVSALRAVSRPRAAPAA